MDNLNPVQCKQIYGVPLGGIGAGSIGKTWTGEFSRFQLVPGLYEYGTIEANLFTICIRKTNYVYQQALVVKKSKLKGFKNWNMEFNGKNATYYALYPQSWTIYKLQDLILTCHQLSPVLPHNYKAWIFSCFFLLNF